MHMDDLDKQILSLTYFQAIYKYTLAYGAMRDLIDGFSYLQTVKSNNKVHIGLIMKFKDYIYFLKEKNSTIHEFPDQIHQIGLTTHKENFVYSDAISLF